MSAYTLTMFWVDYEERLTGKTIKHPQDVIPLLPPWLRKRGRALQEVALEGAEPGVKTLEVGSVRVAYYCPQCKTYYGGPPRMDAHNNVRNLAGWKGYQLTCLSNHVLGNQIQMRS